MTTETEPDTVDAECDEGMISHIVCPECNPNWHGTLGFPALCGEKLLGIPADGKRTCKTCEKLWYKHVREVHMGFSDRG